MPPRFKKQNSNQNDTKKDKMNQEILSSLTPAEILVELQKDSEIKLVNRFVPFEQNFELIDVSLYGKGQDEDKIYAFDEFYRNNVRRGNTYLNIVYPDKTKSCLLARKGLQKFFDLYLEYLENNYEQKFGIKDVEEHKALRDIIFKEVEEELKLKKQIKVYKLVKANGENCQVSYSKETQAWIIASKNVGLLARTEEDLQFYQKEQRYSFAYLIGVEWFRILKDLTNKGKDINALKKDFTAFTLVGEYCGNQEYQHLVKYDKVDLLFYAIVDNNDGVTCIPVDSAYSYFKYHNLSTVPYEIIGTFSNFEDLKKGLKESYVKVAESDLESDQEGSVLYFVSEEKKNETTTVQKTLSLCKLKTLEYRVYRKLREKLKTYIGKLENANYSSADITFKKFRSEVNELCKGYNLPRILDYYFTVAEFAFEFIDNYPKKAKLVHEEYITFLSIVLNCVEKNKKITPLMWAKEYLDKIKVIPWSSYKYGLQLNKPSSSEKSETNSKYSEFEKTSNSQDSRKFLLVLIPLTIPGIGKSYYTKFMKEVIQDDPEIDYFEISSDKVREEAMNSLMRKEKSMSKESAYEKSGKQASLDFFRGIESIMKQINRSHKQTAIFFVDKNHPPNAIKKALETFEGHAPQNRTMKIIAVIPKCLQTMKINKSSYPFSLNMAVNCLVRVIQRENHETLIGTPEKKIEIMSMFLAFFKGVSFNLSSIHSNGFDNKLELPFVYEDLQSDSKYPEKIINTLSEIISSTKPGEICQNKDLIRELAGLLKDFKHEFVYPKPEDCKKAFEDGIRENIPKDKSSSTGKPAQKGGDEKIEEKPKKKSSGSISFIGLFVKDEKGAKEILNKKLEELVKSVDDNFKQKYTFEKLNYPPTLHITALYVGGNEAKQETPYFKEFKENVELNIEIEAFAFVPEGLICAVCLPDKEKLLVENKYPHMTTRTSKPFQPKNSNDVLTSLFTEGGPLEKRHSKEFFRENKGKCLEFDIVIQNVGPSVKRKVYLWCLEETLILPGVTMIHK